MVTYRTPDGATRAGGGFVLICSSPSNLAFNFEGSEIEFRSDVVFDLIITYDSTAYFLRHSGCKPGRSVSAQSPGSAKLVEYKGMQISTLNVTGAAGRMTRLTSNSQGGLHSSFYVNV